MFFYDSLLNNQCSLTEAPVDYLLRYAYFRNKLTMQSISKIITSDNRMADYYWRNAKYLEVLVV